MAGARLALGLVVVCTLLAAGSVRAHDPDPEPDPPRAQQLSGDAPALAADGLEGVDGGPAHLALRSGASVDATDEFLDEIYVERPGMLQALANELDEAELIAAIEDPSNECSGTALCQLGNLYAAEGCEADAFKCFKASAESFDLGGMYNYAHALLRGRGCDKNEASATAWFREAAAIICDTKTFLKRHFPQRFLVSEPGSNSKEELCMTFDDESHQPTRVVSAASGSILWDHVTDSDEKLHTMFEGLEVEPVDTEEDAVERLPPPAPARSGFQQAAIDMSALVDSAGLGRALSADADFETGRVAVRSSDGGSATLDTKETLAALLLQVSLSRARVDNASAFNEGLQSTSAWTMAIDVLNKGAAAGDGPLTAVLATLYANGLGVEPDAERAQKLMLQAARKGVPEALNNAALYLLASPAAKEAKNAKTFPIPHRYFERVWHFLPGIVRRAIAEVADTGYMSEAHMLLHRAAARGCAAARYNLALALHDAGADIRLVADLYQEAAAQGHGAAMNNLALLYLSGAHPAGRNIVEARKLLRKAAEEPSGIYLATDSFAKELFDGGDYDEEDPDRDLGQVPGKNPAKEALYNLGIVNELGLGAKPNLVSASRWYSLALEKGLRDAGAPTLLF